MTNAYTVLVVDDEPARGAAPRLPGTGRIAGVRVRRPVSRSGTPARHAWRPRDQAIAEGVRAASSSRGTCRQGADASPIVARSLGAGAGGGSTISAGVHPWAAAKARTRSDSPDPYPDRAGGGLPPPFAAGPVPAADLMSPAAYSISP